MPTEDTPISLRARYVFPAFEPPIAEGAVTILRERIAAVGPAANAANVADLGQVAILPGLVNVHTHLEFSDLTEPLGLAGMAFPDWIREVVAYRSRVAGVVRESVELGLRESLAAGTTALGEIATAGWQREPFQNSAINAIVFLEAIGLGHERIAASLSAADSHLASIDEGPRRGYHVGTSPHAPYSVHPELLVGLVERAVRSGAPVAMHLAESLEEIELLWTGSGAFRNLLTDFGVWNPSAIPLRARPLDYLRILAKAPRGLVVHGNYLDDEELSYLATQRGRLSLVYCPRTHARFGHAPHPLPRLLAAGGSAALGTDSRASNPDLSMLAEMRFVAQHLTAISPPVVLQLGTLAGARALGLDYEFGSLEPGKLANLTVVRLPEHVTRDPYELLFNSEEGVVATMIRGRWT